MSSNITLLQTMHSRYYRGDITWVVILHFYKLYTVDITEET